MPRIINKTVETKTVTKEGECQVTIVLDLNINLTSDGLKVSVLTEQDKKDEETNWAIPDFAPQQKVKFGKKE